MEIEILEYINDPKGIKKGLVDIKVIYTPEKSETFRGLSFFEKEDRRWVNFPNTKRGNHWVPYYERSPGINKDILIMTLKAVEEHLNTSNPKVTHEDVDFFC